MGIFKKNKKEKQGLNEVWQELKEMMEAGTVEKWLAIERAVAVARNNGVLEEFEKQLEQNNRKLVDCPFCKKKLIVIKDETVKCTNCQKTVRALW